MAQKANWMAVFLGSWFINHRYEVRMYQLPLLQINKQTNKIHTKKIFHLIAPDAVHDDQQQWTWFFFELCRKSFRHVELVKLLEK
jgi:hypothetical protein